MIGDRPSSRVSTLVWPIDPILRAVRVWFPPTAAAGASLLTLPLASSMPNPLMLVVPVIVAVFTGAHVYRRYSSQLVASLYRRHALAVISGIDGMSGHWLARMLTAWPLKSPRFEYADQRDVLARLLDDFQSEVRGQFWVVQGDSGSGKTRTALLLAQTLASVDARDSEGPNCILYDFSSIDSQHRLLTRLGGASHLHRVVLVDNFHLASAEVLREMSTTLLDQSRRLPEALVVLFARPVDYWTVNPQRDVRLVERAITLGRFSTLRGPAAEPIARRLGRLDKASMTAVQAIGLERSGRATGVQLHLAQAFVRRREAPEIVSTVAQLLFGEAVGPAPAEVLGVLAIASGLAVHRGTFRRDSFRRTLRTLSKEHLAELGGRASLMRVLDEMCRVGLVLQPQASSRRLVFHESLAEQCIDHLSSRSHFLCAFEAAVCWRLAHEPIAADEAWLLATEINSTPQMVGSFDTAAAAGAYGRMVHCLERLVGRQPSLDVDVVVQRAILLDRVGRFTQARSVFDNLDLEAIRVGNALIPVLISGRIEAEHDADDFSVSRCERDASGLACSDSPVVAAVGEYWQLHLAAHRGHFSADRLHEIAQQLGEAGRSSQSHWLTYQTLRAHVDSYRHLYLSGRSTADTVFDPERDEITRSLALSLAITEAFETLYTRAHWVAHVLLPTVGIFGGSLTDQLVGRLDICEGATDSERLVLTGLREYRRARTQFAQYGDREALYLQIDELNMEMISADADLASLKDRLAEYSDFITRSNFNKLRSYPELYRWRWFALQHFQTLLSQPESLGRYTYLERAEQALLEVIRIDKTYGNAYGEFRAEFLLSLTRWISGLTSGESSIDGLNAWATTVHTRAKAMGYGIEMRVADWLSQPRPLTMAELRDLFRFFPLVHQ